MIHGCHFRWQRTEWTHWQYPDRWRRYCMYNLYGEEKGHRFPLWPHGVPCLWGIPAELSHVSASHFQEDPNLFVGPSIRRMFHMVVFIKRITGRLNTLLRVGRCPTKAVVAPSTRKDITNSAVHFSLYGDIL